MPAFLIDECVSLQTVWLFKALGLSYKTVYDPALSGKSDSAIFKTAQDMESVLVTLARGFGDVRAYPHSHNGIIILRSSDSSSLQKCHCERGEAILLTLDRLPRLRLAMTKLKELQTIKPIRGLFARATLGLALE